MTTDPMRERLMRSAALLMDRQGYPPPDHYRLYLEALVDLICQSTLGDQMRERVAATIMAEAGYAPSMEPLLTPRPGRHRGTPDPNETVFPYQEEGRHRA